MRYKDMQKKHVNFHCQTLVMSLEFLVPHIFKKVEISHATLCKNTLPLAGPRQTR